MRWIHSRYVTAPSDSSTVNFHDNTLATSFSVNLLIWDLIWRQDAANLGGHPLWKDSNLLMSEFVTSSTQNHTAGQISHCCYTVRAWYSDCTDLTSIRLPRYVKSSTNSSGSPLAVIGYVGEALTHYLSVGCVDLETCLLSIGFQSSSLIP